MLSPLAHLTDDELLHWTIIALIANKTDHNESTASFAQHLKLARALLARSVHPSRLRQFPSTFKTAWQTVRHVLTTIRHVDCCPAGCVLYEGELANATNCPRRDCGIARYKAGTQQAQKKYRYVQAPVLFTVRVIRHQPTASRLICFCCVMLQIL
jgi:hypothetical protein